MLNLHCNNNDKKKNIKKKHDKVMRTPRYEPRIYAMEPMELIDKDNQYILKL